METLTSVDVEDADRGSVRRYVLEAECCESCEGEGESGNQEREESILVNGRCGKVHYWVCWVVKVEQ